MNDGQNPGHDWTRKGEILHATNTDPEDEGEEEETELPEWGDIDPQHDPSRPAGPMDPSGPGSAV